MQLGGKSQCGVMAQMLFRGLELAEPSAAGGAGVGAQPVAGVADAVAVAVGLAGIGHPRAVVGGVGHAVAIVVGVAVVDHAVAVEVDVVGCARPLVEDVAVALAVVAGDWLDHIGVEAAIAVHVAIAGVGDAVTVEVGGRG